MLGKFILDPLHVGNAKVHKTASVKGHASVKVDPECGYLLHMHWAVLVSNTRPWNPALTQAGREQTLVQADWIVGDKGSGIVRVADEHERLLSGRECLSNGHSLLRRCTQG